MSRHLQRRKNLLKIIAGGSTKRATGKRGVLRHLLGLEGTVALLHDKENITLFSGTAADVRTFATESLEEHLRLIAVGSHPQQLARPKKVLGFTLRTRSSDGRCYPSAYCWLAGAARHVSISRRPPGWDIENPGKSWEAVQIISWLERAPREYVEDWYARHGQFLAYWTDGLPGAKTERKIFSSTLEDLYKRVLAAGWPDYPRMYVGQLVEAGKYNTLWHGSASNVGLAARDLAGGSMSGMSLWGAEYIK